MAAPDDQKELKPSFQAPGWMIAAARKKVAEKKVTDDRLAADMQSRGVDTNDEAIDLATAEQVAELHGEDERNPFKNSAQPLQEPGNISEPQSRTPLKIVLPKVNSQVEEKRRDTQVERRDERRTKKEKSRVKQAQAPTPAQKSDPISPLFAESSSAGAQREAASASLSPLNTALSQSLFISEDSKDRYPFPHPVLPTWYTSISETSFKMKELVKKGRPQELVSLDNLKTCIGRCEMEKKLPQLNRLYEELRDHVHKAEIKLAVDQYSLKKARILSSENGLPRIFKEEADFPSDLKVDGYQLYRRWYDGNFEQNILRGLVTVKGKDRNGDRLDVEYRKKHPTEPKVYGANGLVLGQWWPYQLCTVRDGAHGAVQGGIFGEKDKGAYSIVLSGGGYHDNDDGDVIEYSGTEGKDFTSTENTNHLIKSKDLENPIRVIRSAQLAKKNKYRPVLGLRYDGLYKVKDYKIVDKETAMYRFHLVRCEGQEPIRCEDNAARRPTIFEVEAWDKLKGKVW